MLEMKMFDKQILLYVMCYLPFLRIVEVRIFCEYHYEIASFANWKL